MFNELFLGFSLEIYLKRNQSLQKAKNNWKKKQLKLFGPAFTNIWVAK